MKIGGLTVKNRIEAVDYLLGTKQAGDNVVVIKTESGMQFLPADTVILSVGYNPYNPFKTTSGNIHVIGDAAGVGNLMSVINGAYRLAYKL